MNKITFLIILITFYSCNGIRGNGIRSNDKLLNVPLSQIQTNKYCIPDSNLFYYKHLINSIDLDSIDILDKMNGLNAKQVEAWIQPLFSTKVTSSKSELYIKMASFQDVMEKYSSIIISINFEMPKQYFITVNNEGKFVNGIPISYIKNLSNSEVEYDSVRNIYRFMNKVISRLSRDTLKVFSLEMLSEKKEANNDKDFFEELYESDYKIDENGLINLIYSRKKINRDYIDIHF